MKGKAANMMAHWVERNYFDVLDCKIVNCDACSNIKLNAKHLKQMHLILRQLASLGHLSGWGRQRDRQQLLGKEVELRGGWVRKLRCMLRYQAKCEALEANAPNFSSAGFDGSRVPLGKAERLRAIAGEGGRTTRRLGGGRCC